MPAEINVNLSSLRSLSIEMFFDDTKLADGTAFVAEFDNRIGLITNRHNVTGRNQTTHKTLSSHGGVPNRLLVWHHCVKDALQWLPIEIELYDDGLPTWYEHPILGENADVVVLPIGDIHNIVLNTYDLSRKSEIIQRPADTVSVVGFPFGRASVGKVAIWATGFIASEPDLPFDDLPVILIDCRSRPGQSGSPVIMQRNDVYWSEQGLMSPYTRAGKTEFIGIYSGRIHPDSDLGTVWKACVISEILSFYEALADPRVID